MGGVLDVSDKYQERVGLLKVTAWGITMACKFILDPR